METLRFPNPKYTKGDVAARHLGANLQFTGDT